MPACLFLLTSLLSLHSELCHPWDENSQPGPKNWRTESYCEGENWELKTLTVSGHYLPLQTVFSVMQNPEARRVARPPKHLKINKYSSTYLQTEIMNLQFAKNRRTIFAKKTSACCFALRKHSINHKCRKVAISHFFATAKHFLHASSTTPDIIDSNYMKRELAS